ncbi:MFS transporter family glucose-6-phosphate receptor UhpC, partial [Vibrio parahaemolyticus]|nr:MFS transporter family glucose-6-phosphate receptor UhpC [Vibrio parahaemolyticus]NMS18193.1 MFS transporter family glucose-6-phosphate receptor UhpC [Vibrio parahaemolyticus]
MFGLFQSPSYDRAPLSKEQVDKRYRYWRLHIMLGMYLGYAGFYFTRKTFNYAAPAMIADLGLDKADIGMIGTLFYITYGLSK